MNTSSLIKNLTESLTKFGYITDDAEIPDVHFIAYVKDPKPLMVKDLCAIVEVPNNIDDEKKAKHFFQVVENILLQQYGKAILWKELEICLVVICNSNMFNILKSNDARAVDPAGFKLYAMMGSCFINKETYDNFNKSTWGLYFSGEHFKVINNTVVSWCSEQKGA